MTKKKDTNLITFTKEELGDIVRNMMEATPFVRPMTYDYSPIEKLKYAESLLYKKLKEFSADTKH